MQLKLKEIADLLKAELIGDPNIVIKGISGIKEAKEGDITFLANSKYLPLLKDTQASAVIVSLDIGEYFNKAIIKIDKPSLAFNKVVDFLSPYKTKHPQGIHPKAIIADKVYLGKNIAIGPYTIIEEGANIADNTIIYGGCFIGQDTEIGKDCLIYPLVSIRERVEIKDRVIIHSGAVIGSDGFGFINVDGRQVKIPQIGTVLIENDVEIGANVAIDRARFDKTVIGEGTKIDNLVHIAHNVIIGKNCTIVAQVGISGSTTIGNNAILAGQAGLVGHINIGDNAIIAAQAGVTKSVKANTFVSGYPARPHDQARRVNACVQNLPDLYKRIKELEENIDQLTKIIAQSNIK